MHAFKSRQTLAKLVVCLFFAASLPAKAAEIQSYASVNIVSALAITESQTIDFGNLASSQGVCSMSADGALTTGSSVCKGQGQAGTLAISGQAGAFVNVQMFSGSADRLTFTPDLPPASNRIQLGENPYLLAFGGKLKLDSPTNGKHAIRFGITANYE